MVLTYDLHNTYIGFQQIAEYVYTVTVLLRVSLECIWTGKAVQFVALLSEVLGSLVSFLVFAGLVRRIQLFIHYYRNTVRRGIDGTCGFFNIWCLAQ